MWAFFRFILARFNPAPALFRVVEYPYTFNYPPDPRPIEAAGFQLAQQKIKAAEGYRRDVYKDTRGILTVGIGHRVTASDNLNLGQMITDQQVQAFFAVDVNKAFEAAKNQAAELGKYTPEMIAALTSVNFQLGTGWRDKFYNTWKSLKAGNAQDAINRLQQSAWNDQTPSRVTAFIQSIRSSYA